VVYYGRDRLGDSVRISAYRPEGSGPRTGQFFDFQADTGARNSRLKSQQSYNQLAAAMRSQVRWHCTDDELNPFIRWNPVRPLVQWYNGHQMNNYISKELDRRFSEYQCTGRSMGSRSVIDLALEDYMADNPSSQVSKSLDPEFKAWATVQIRLFLFAGHDSTSSTICYCYYLLSKYPEAMSKIRAEHDEVFGTDLSRVTTLLREQPHLINQLPYTLAVMKEVLRLFPPAAALRGGLPGVELHDSDGNRYPTAGMNIWVLHNALQRNPRYWKDADAFLPERWLVGTEDPLYPIKGGWRPFEFGPRNCVGQTLVTLNIRIVLVMTIRRFDVRDAYNEWDRLHPSKGIKRVNGERAYQISSGGAHPADGFPCKVSLRK
jgi:Cytochrome P450